MKGILNSFSLRYILFFLVKNYTYVVVKSFKVDDFSYLHALFDLTKPIVMLQTMVVMFLIPFIYSVLFFPILLYVYYKKQKTQTLTVLILYVFFDVLVMGLVGNYSLRSSIILLNLGLSTFLSIICFYPEFLSLTSSKQTSSEKR